jgi:hypothetical protein
MRREPGCWPFLARYCRRRWLRTFALLFGLLWLAGFQEPARAGQFFPAVNYPVGQDPFFVVVGDFNRDGVPDLAVANAAQGQPEGSISILLGKGNGMFQAAKNHDSGGAEPSALAVGDFNADGKLDLAVANRAGGGGPENLSVLLGNGDGTLRAPQSYTVGFEPQAVATEDLDGDGKLDLAVASDVSEVKVLFGKGDGTFKAGATYHTGTAATSIVVADFNRDGKPDLAVANENDDNVSILLGTGHGTFQPAVNYGAGAGPASVVAGDLNRDGKLDLVVANAASSFGTTINVLLGNGDGTFQAAVSYDAGAEPISVAVSDFDGDGKLDVAVADFDVGDGEAVSLLLGNGNGTFQPPVESDVPKASDFVLAADLDQDGLADLVTANIGSNNVSVLLNAGSPCVSRPEITDVQADPNELWPPDHQLVDVFVSYNAISRCGGTPKCMLKVSSSDRDSDKDWVIIDAHHVKLRAERSDYTGREHEFDINAETGEADRHKKHSRHRVYKITVKCTDTSGNSGTAHTFVKVAHDREPD